MLPDSSPHHAALNRLQTGRFHSNPMGSNPPLFLPAVAYHSGGYDFSLAVAGVNGDGKPDLLVADYNGSVEVLLGNGDGTFQPPPPYNSLAPPPPSPAPPTLNRYPNPALVCPTLTS